MKKLIALFLFLLGSSLHAQSFNTDSYDWDKAEYQNVSVDDSTNQHIILTKRLFHYYYNDQNELTGKYLFHKKVHINSNSAIERLNKVYISQNEDNLSNFKARVINSSGKVNEISKDKILTGVDEDTEQEYIYFAMEGLEIGSQIEYFFIKEISTSLNGILQEIQTYDPVQRFELDVVTPWNLVMIGKVYNMDKEFSIDTSFENQNYIYLHADSIDPMKEETSAFIDAHLAKAIFKLDQNLYTGKNNLVAYSHIAQRVIDNLNRELSKKEIKTLSKIQKEIANFETEVEVSPVRRMENYLKSNFQYIKHSNPVLSEITSIYSNKAFNETGALLIYTHLLKTMEVEYKLTYTSDRTELPFDPDFAANIYLQDLLIYIDDEDQFIDPVNSLTRLGYVGDKNLHNYGLFMEEMRLNNNVVAIASTDFIPAKRAAFTMDTLEVSVNFDDAFIDNSLHIRRVLSGYTAGFYQPILGLIKDEDSRKNFEESILTYVDSEAQVEDYEIENGIPNLLGVKPLIAEGKLATNNFIENAGNNILFKVGTLIGPQSEMYNEEGERLLNVETSHARGYHRTITFEIPEGFEVSGLEELNMDEKLIYKDETSGRFLSSYTQDGSTITVTIYEYYDEVEYPKELFEEYRKVINAAADFNKKTLLLKAS
ncbi:DUF3857 domain-containing protein [Owenweeksia hongkongensis]|uniref:DUF3857 domain-containing protein n=1 Tax=Owenweeksia hongkongensis TaxID=253245 RepID=UPI003A8E904D